MAQPVIIYTTPTCGFCHMAKEYFESKNVEYQDKDVTKDAEAYKEILDKSGQLGVPVIDIDGSVVVGFDRPKIDDALAKRD
jgi:glutaredoxin 3